MRACVLAVLSDWAVIVGVSGWAGRRRDNGTLPSCDEGCCEGQQQSVRRCRITISISSVHATVTFTCSQHPVSRTTHSGGCLFNTCTGVFAALAATLFFNSRGVTPRYVPFEVYKDVQLDSLQLQVCVCVGVRGGAVGVVCRVWAVFVHLAAPSHSLLSLSLPPTPLSPSLFPPVTQNHTTTARPSCLPPGLQWARRLPTKPGPACGPCRGFRPPQNRGRAAV